MDSFPFILVLAAEVGAVVLVAALASRRGRAHWKRTVWQVCFLGLIWVLTFEFSGAGSGFWNWWLATSRRELHQAGANAEVLPQPKPLMHSSKAAMRGLASETVSTAELRDPLVISSQQANVAKLTVDLGLAKAGQKAESPATLDAPDLTAFGSRDSGEDVTARETKSGIPAAAEEHVAASISRPAALHRALRAEDVTFWTSVVWTLGTILLLGRLLLGYVVLAWLCFREGNPPPDDALSRRARDLSGLLGGPGEVSLVGLSFFRGPIAFGLTRGLIGLPLDFSSRFSREEQDAMMAHELAHLEGRDPLWRLVSEVATALLWWHPLVWWARRCLREESEAAADLASLIVRGGPALLAECLVRCASANRFGHAGGFLDLAGGEFKSSLGKRVSRLCALVQSTPESFRRSDPFWAKAAIAFVLAFMTAGAAVVASPTPLPLHMKGTSLMKNLTQSWMRSSAALMLATVLATADSQDTAGTGDSSTKPQPAAGSAGAAPSAPAELPQASAPALPAAPSTEARPGTTPAFKMDLDLMRRHGLIPVGGGARGIGPQAGGLTDASAIQVLNLLSGIMLEDVRFENVPLGEALKWLDDQVRAKDPKRQGVNFILAPMNRISSRPPAGLRSASVNQVEGADIADVRGVLVNISPSLKDIRVTDALDALVKCSTSPIRVEYLSYGVIVAPADTPPISSSPGSTGFMMSEAMMKRYGLVPSQGADGRPAPSLPDREARDYAKRVENLRVGELSLEKVSIRKAVTELQRISKNSKQASVNFLFSTLLDAPQWPLPPGPQSLGMGDWSSTDLGEVPVRLLLPLKNVSLRDACDAIARVADIPLRYSVQPYCIVFSPDWDRIPWKPSGVSPGAAPLPALASAKQTPELRTSPMPPPPRPATSVRSFRIADVPGFVAGLTAATRIVIPKSTPRHEEIAKSLGKLARDLGAKLEGEDRYLHFEERTGMLLARATEADFAVIEALIETFAGQILAGESTAHAENAPLRPQRTGAFVSVLGAVGNPGRFAVGLGQKWTFVDAIAAAGGFAKNSNQNKITVTRQGKKSVYRFEDVKGDDPKFVVEHGDLIEVPESVF